MIILTILMSSQPIKSAWMITTSPWAQPGKHSEEEDSRWEGKLEYLTCFECLVYLQVSLDRRGGREANLSAAQARHEGAGVRLRGLLHPLQQVGGQVGQHRTRQVRSLFTLCPIKLVII